MDISKATRVWLACLGSAALAGTAAAADLPPPELPNYKAPPPPAWAGLYVGVNGGGAFGHSAWDSSGGFDLSGGLAGGTIGYNYHYGMAVLGIEGDVDIGRIQGTTTSACPPGCTTSNHWLATVRGRLGYAADRFMPYVAGGIAFGDVRGTGAPDTGWTIGAGLEFAVADAWTIRAEYLFVDLGRFNCIGCAVAAAVDNVSFTTSIVRGGIDYRF